MSEISVPSVMSDPDTESQVTIERRRREQAVAVGRQQVFALELERRWESRQRKIQELLRRNQGLERLLGEIEKEKQEEQPGAMEEAARRQAVVKLWRLQVKMMERQRGLEKLMGLALERKGSAQVVEDNLEIYNRILEHVHSEELLEMVGGSKVLSGDPRPLEFLASTFSNDDLVDIERLIEENEEEARALR